MAHLSLALHQEEMEGSHRAKDQQVKDALSW